MFVYRLDPLKGYGLRADRDEAAGTAELTVDGRAIGEAGTEAACADAGVELNSMLVRCNAMKADSFALQK